MTETWPGTAYPLGATFDGSGTNFALFSEVAERVELCLFEPDPANDGQFLETRVEVTEVDAYVWHCYLPTVQPGQRYGYRVHGPWDPENGLRCNPSKLLLDPYAKATSGDIDWDHLFGELGVRWLHTGGIFAALSDSTAEVAVEAVAAARRHGTVVSYDLNYRPSLWQSIGGQDRAREVNREIARHVDVMIGNEEDFTASLGFEVPGVDESLTDLDAAAFRAMIEQVTQAYPNFAVVATTLRGVVSATVNDWGAVAWSAAAGFVSARQRDGLEILDRVGGGDSFASGLVYGLITGEDLQTAVEAVEVPRPALREVLVEGVGQVLLGDPHVGQVRVRQVRQGDVDQPVVAADRERRLGPAGGQWSEPRPPTAGQHHAQCAYTGHPQTLPRRLTGHAVFTVGKKWVRTQQPWRLSMALCATAVRVLSRSVPDTAPNG